MEPKIIHCEDDIIEDEISENNNESTQKYYIKKFCWKCLRFTNHDITHIFLQWKCNECGRLKGPGII